MKLKTLFSITAVLFIAWGLVMLFGNFIVSAMNLTPTAVEIYLARAGATLLIGMGVMAWLSRAAGPSPARDAVVVGFVVANSLAVVVGLIAILDGTAPPAGWIGVALNALLALGFYLTGWPGRAAE